MFLPQNITFAAVNLEKHCQIMLFPSLCFTISATSIKLEITGWAKPTKDLLDNSKFYAINHIFETFITEPILFVQFYDLLSFLIDEDFFELRPDVLPSKIE